MGRKRVDIHSSTPLRHVEEEELEAAIKDGLMFHVIAPDAPEVEVLGQITGINTFAEVNAARIIDGKGLMLFMKDGSEFRLSIMRVHEPKYEHEDQIE